MGSAPTRRQRFRGQSFFDDRDSVPHLFTFQRGGLGSRPAAFVAHPLIHSRLETMESSLRMKRILLAALLVSAGVVAAAQSASQPSSTTAAKPAAKPAARSATAPKAAAPASPLVAAVIKAPANIPQHKGIQKPVFTVALRYQEIKVGTGPAAATNKQYKVFYTGYRAADGAIFDSTDKHRLPLRDKDGKPIMGPDGKPKLGDPQPLPFVQGVGGAIPGFDQGFVGMKVGGKRRIFIPWQMAYGTHSIQDHGPDHPGIPAKADLIFDVELVDVSEPPPPQPPRSPMMMPGGRPMPGTPGGPPAGTPGHPATAPGQPGAPGTPANPAAPGTANPSAAPSGAPSAAPGSAPTATPGNPPSGSVAPASSTTTQPK
jgi:peptidylprolyl isomerase